MKHTHSWESCPYNDPGRAAETFGKAMAGLASSDMTVVGAWADVPAHTTFWILDAESPAEIEQALAPIIDLGWAQTRPVSDLNEALGRATDRG